MSQLPDISQRWCTSVTDLPNVYLSGIPLLQHFAPILRWCNFTPFIFEFLKIKIYKILVLFIHTWYSCNGWYGYTLFIGNHQTSSTCTVWSGGYYQVLECDTPNGKSSVTKITNYLFQSSVICHLSNAEWNLMFLSPVYV